MHYIIEAPQQLKAHISVPSSKSICNRALIIHALAKGKQPVGNLSDCDDTSVMVRALRDMPQVIDIMAAGTAMRFLSAYLAVTPGTHTITGTERMRHRPIQLLVDALRTLGAQVEYEGEEGFPPLRISGGNHVGGALSLPGNVSSQYISALLMIGPALQQGLTLTLTGNIVSRPYIDLTLQLMQEFGAVAEWTDSHTLKVQPGGYKDRPYFVEGDWSGASYWFEMMALSPDNEASITLPGLFEASHQGDSAVHQLFERLGVHTSFGTKDGLQTVTLTKSNKVVPRLDYNFVNQPDLAQTFVVTCAMMGIPFRFTGLQSLKIKETDRITALRTELRKLGFDIHEQDDSVLYWDGERCEPQTEPAIDTYEDHRMAMAFAPVCLKMPHIRINEPGVVSKSYPAYWKHLQMAGFTVTEQ